MDLKNIHNRNDLRRDLAFLAFLLVVRTFYAAAFAGLCKRLRSFPQAEMLGMLNPTVDHFYYVYSSSPYSGAKDLNSWMLQKTTHW